MTRIGSICTGYSGLDLGLQAVIGGTVAFFADNDPAAAKVLAHHWPDTPNLGDITAVNWRQVELVDWLTAGFPCQDVSLAGRRAGLKPGTRSGLWTHIAHVISVLRPQHVLIENTPGLRSAEAHSDMEPCPWCLGDNPDVHALRALGAVLGDLVGLGFDAQWVSVRASDVGSCHQRERVFVLACDTDRVARSPRSAFGWRPPTVDEPGAVERIVGPDGAHAAADAEGDGRDEGWPEPARLLRGPDAPLGGATPDRCPLAPGWGRYEPAIRRWERLTRPAPCPFDHNSDGSHHLTAQGKVRLNPELPEWMQGLPAGHVTAVPGLTRNDQLRLLGNGVVPQQCALAVRMLTDLEEGPKRMRA